MLAVLIAVALLAIPAAYAQDTQAPVTAEFRVFSGTDEITATTRLRIMATGTREKSSTIQEGKRLVTSVAPGIYDVQALRLRPEGIVAIRWAERLVVMHYPDEGGRHLEVINFQQGYGALQLRAAKGSIEDYVFAVFSTGDRTVPAAEPLQGDGYRLFVVKAGRYDVRVRHAGSQNDAQDTHWMLDVEVPADRTRLKLVETDEFDYTTVRRPLIRFTRNSTSAITSSTWTMPPATSKANPSSQNSNSRTISVQSMSLLPPSQMRGKAYATVAAGYYRRRC